jgi:glycerate kinase
MVNYICTGTFFSGKMHILIAPNAFKNSLPAADAAEAIRRGILQSGLNCSTHCFPIGDGGDGTASLITNFFAGTFYETIGYDPAWKQIKSNIGFIEGGQTAVIEMADISGLKLLDPTELDPLYATSFGCGELLRAAMDQGARKIILAIGGSATVDGGCGILQALGVRFMDKLGNELSHLPESLGYLDGIDLSGIDKRIWNTELVVLCDVENHLLGERGAAAVFGPQKGASPEDVIRLENALQKLRDVSLRHTGVDMNVLTHGGAAGGTAATLHIFLKAKLVPGIEYFLDISGFDEALRQTNLLITGEGAIDYQTIEGKAPFGVARRAKKYNIPVVALAGQLPLEPDARITDHFDVLMTIGHQPEDLTDAMLHTAKNLEQTARQLGNMIKIFKT